MTSDHVASRAAVLGHPVNHSLSPVLHRTAYQALGLAWRYDAVDVTTDQLPDFIEGLDEEWAGLSLTMPLKEAVLPLLNQVDPLARRLRSVNTVLFSKQGRTGYNTDVHGLVESIAGLKGSVPDEVVVVGAGATARSSVAALAHLRIPRVVVAARRPSAARELSELAADLGLSSRCVAWPPSPEELSADLVISTVPLPGSERLLDRLPAQPQTLVEVLYEPWPTPLSTAWVAAGGKAVSGLELLVHQAVEQVRLMTGAAVDPTILRAAGLAELDRRHIAQAEQ